MPENMLPLGVINQKTEIGGQPINIPTDVSIGIVTDATGLKLVLDATANLSEIQDKFNTIAKALEPLNEIKRRDGESISICVHHLIETATLEPSGEDVIVKCAAACEVWSVAKNPIGGFKTEMRKWCTEVVIPAKIFGKEYRYEKCVDVPASIPYVIDGPDIKLSLGSDKIDATANISLKILEDAKVDVDAKIVSIGARGLETDWRIKAIKTVSDLLEKVLLREINNMIAGHLKPVSIATLLPDQLKDCPVVLSEAKFFPVNGKFGVKFLAEIDIPADKISEFIKPK